MLRPKLLTTLKGYNRKQFLADLSAGTIVGIVALPLSIAFAIASGVSPEKGLITAIIGGFLISALGGSRVQIGGPTGAFIVIVYGIVQRYGVDGLVIASIMAGVLLVIMGLARFGSLIKFIPHPVIVGFTSGIALIIFSSEVKDFLGLRMGAVPADFLEKWIAFGHSFGSANFAAVALAVGSLLVLIVWPRFSQKIPAPLVVLLLATVTAQFLHLHVETIGSRFGVISSALPYPSIPYVDLATVRSLFGPALTIAMLAAIESLLSAVVADGMIGGKHRSNMELVAQGVANIASPIFGGISCTGAIARTATNIKNGGRTPVAGMIHSLTLLLIMLFFGQWAGLIPLAVLAAILVVVAYNMSEWRSFLSLLKNPRSDVLVLLSTFLLTVLVDLTVAIEVGMLLAVFLFMQRMAAVTNVGVVTRELEDEVEEQEDPNAVASSQIPPDTQVFEINGPFFFGAAYKFEEAMKALGSSASIYIIRMRNVPAIDSTGLHMLQGVNTSCRHGGRHLIIAEIHTQPLIAFEKSGLLKEIGEENVLGSFGEAIARAREILGIKSDFPEISPTPTT